MTNAPIVDESPDLTMSAVDSRIVTDAIDVIDRALSQMVKRELVSSGEVSDLLLDVRNLLSSAGKQS